MVGKINQQIKGNTKPETFRTLLKNTPVNTENNYLTEHLDAPISRYGYLEQAIIGVGILLKRTYTREVPDKVRDDYIPRFDKGDLIPLYKRIFDDIHENYYGHDYDDLLAFVSGGLLLYAREPLDDVDLIGFYRVIGETLAHKFTL